MESASISRPGITPGHHGFARGTRAPVSTVSIPASCFHPSEMLTAPSAACFFLYVADPASWLLRRRVRYPGSPVPATLHPGFLLVLRSIKRAARRRHNNHRGLRSAWPVGLAPRRDL